MMILAGAPGPLVDRICDLVVACNAGLADAGGDGVPATAPTSAALQVVIRPDMAGQAPPANMVIAADEPAASFARLRHIGLTAVQALRELTACDAVLGALARAGAPVVTVDSLMQPDSILAHFGLRPIAPLPAIAAMPPPASLPEQEHAMLTAVLPQGFGFIRGGKRHAMRWPLACFFNGDIPEEPAPDGVQLAGPARVLIFGPYFHLPPGIWTLRARLRFSAACAGTWFALELHGKQRLGRCRFQAPTTGLDAAGLYAADFAASVSDPAEPVEARLVLERGAIEGEIALLDICLTPAADL